MDSDSENNCNDILEESKLYLQLYYGERESNPAEPENIYPSQKICGTSHNKNTSQESTLKTKSSISSKPNPVPSEGYVSKRKRQVSICSTGSISGKIPLDDLYCLDDPIILPSINEENNISNPKSLDTISKPVSKYDNNVSKFSKNKNIVLETIELSDSGLSDINVISVDTPHKKRVSSIEVTDFLSDESIICLDEPSDTDSLHKNKRTKKLLNESSSGSENEQLLSNASLTYNIPRKFQKKISMPEIKKNVIPTKQSKSSVIYTKIRPLSSKEPSCVFWTPEMTTFYDSDISEDIQLDNVHSTQTDSSRCWKIISEDYYAPTSFRYFNQAARCKICRQFDHKTAKCPKVPVCRFCGSSEHSTIENCPHNCCLRCGENHSGYCYITSISDNCFSCGFPGHKKNLCTNNWRIFHNTIKGSKPIIIESEDPKKTAWCCNCGKKGHYGYECDICEISQKYTIVPQIVRSYKSAHFYERDCGTYSERKYTDTFAHDKQNEKREMRGKNKFKSWPYDGYEEDHSNFPNNAGDSFTAQYDESDRHTFRENALNMPSFKNRLRKTKTMSKDPHKSFKSWPYDGYEEDHSNFPNNAGDSFTAQYNESDRHTFRENALNMPSFKNRLRKTKKMSKDPHKSFKHHEFSSYIKTKQKANVHPINHNSGRPSPLMPYYDQEAVNLPKSKHSQRKESSTRTLNTINRHSRFSGYNRTKRKVGELQTKNNSDQHVSPMPAFVQSALKLSKSNDRQLKKKTCNKTLNNIKRYRGLSIYNKVKYWKKK